MKDRSGNFMTIDYDSAIDATTRALQYWPATISYTGSEVDGGAPARRTVKFVYEDRIPFDQQFSFSAGIRFALMKRLHSIEMYAPPQPGHQPVLVWHYDLEYIRSDSTMRELLKSVRMVDRQSVSLWAKYFDWNSETDGSNWSGSEPTVIDNHVGQRRDTTVNVNPVYFPPPDDKPLVLDADGDGKDDLLYWDSYEFQPGGSYPHVGKIIWHLPSTLKTGPLSLTTSR